MSDETGFCCRCGKETNRKEQVGLIVGWVCSTSCSFKASQEFARPPTPELDKYRAAMPFINVLGEFTDWLSSDENGIFLCHTIEIEGVSGPWPIQESYPDLLNRFFNIDPEKLEKEKKMLGETILKCQRIAASRRPA